MNTRLKEIRLAKGMTQEEMGAALGVTGGALSRWETGDRDIPNIVIQYICEKYGVSENWLRYGEGEMFAPMSREEELDRQVRRIFSQRPESFQRALITTLLRFDLDSPKWVIVERIFESVYDEWRKSTEEPEKPEGD